MIEKPTLMDLFSRPSATPAPHKASKKSKPISKNEFEDDPLAKILSWRDPLKEQVEPCPSTFKIRETTSIVEDDQEQWGQGFQGILVNVDWDRLSFQQFKRLNLGERLISNGIVFIWGAPGNLSDLFDYFTEQGFQYVENFMFVMLDRARIPPKKKATLSKNSLLNYFKKTAAKEEKEQMQPQKSTNDYEMGRVSKVQQIFMERDGQYFKETQRVLYMFRRHHKTDPLELRHQRTSDAFFTIGNNWQLDWKSMHAVYQMIETLLIKANYQKNKPLRLLEVWGDKNRLRKGWVTVVEQHQQSQQLGDNLEDQEKM